MNNHNKAVYQGCKALLAGALLLMATTAQTKSYDLNGDGVADVLWRNNLGENYLYQMGKLGISQGMDLLAIPTDWSMALIADFDGDAKADILWRNRLTGENVIFLMDAGRLKQERSLGYVRGAAWQPVVAADLKGDHHHDLIWRNSQTGQVYVQQLNNAHIELEQELYTVSRDWSLEAAADTDADGKDDLIWRNQVDGELYIQLFDGSKIKAENSVVRVDDLNWQITAAADFDADGKADLYWRNLKTGENAVITLDGLRLKKIEELTPVSSLDWQVALVADFNKDNRPDFLWHNQKNGDNVLWFFDGLKLLKEQDIGNTGLLWQIQGRKEQVNTAKGKESFVAQCAACHGSDAAGGSVKVSLKGCNSCSDVTTLAQRIMTTMPSTKPGSCNLECSTEIASYLMAQFNAQIKPVSLPAPGQAAYTSQCASCHGVDGLGIVSKGPSLVACVACTDQTSLASRIERTMPLANPGSCEGECAQQTAYYILQQFNKKADLNALASLTLESNKATLYRASLALAGRVPTNDEYAQLLADPNRLDSLLDKLMTEEIFYSRLMEGYNDMLLTDKYMPWESALNLLNSKDYPNRYWYRVPGLDTSVASAERDQYYKMMKDTNEGTARDALQLISYVVRNNRPFTEVLTADYMLVNYASAKAYGVDNQLTFTPIAGTEMDVYPKYDPNLFKEVKIPGYPHAGVLTSAMFLNRFPTTSTNRNRQRSKVVYDFFLDTDILALGGSRPASTAVLNESTPTLDNPACYGCHTIMDPVASIFQNFNAQGAYRPSRLNGGWPSDMEARGFAGVTMPLRGNQDASERWLAQEIIKDPRFAKAAVRNVYRILFGRSPLLAGATTAVERDAYQLQRSYLSDIEQRFTSQGYNLKQVFKDLVKSPYFRSQSLTSADAALHKDIGSARLLAPESLQRKINSVIGFNYKKYSWSGDSRLLEKDYRLLFGGIDSDSITKRMTQINGVMVAVKDRMASELACQAVIKDFFWPAANRALFPFVAIDTVPANADGTAVPSNQDLIKKNIQYLHWRLLGEDLSLTDPELLATYDLFKGVFDDGRKLLKADLSKNKYMPDACRLYYHPVTNERLTTDQEVVRDDYYVLRSWMAVLAYLFADYRFIHQ